MSVITNTQNVPRDPKIKNLFIPLRDGEVLLEGDLSQAEARIVAYKAEERTLIQLFERGEKVHEYVASIIFQKKVNKKEDPLSYQVGKTIAHASNYGTSPQKIAQILLNETGTAVDVNECRLRQNVYFQNFPRIKSVFQAEIKHELETKMRKLYTPIGFGGWSRKFNSAFGDELLRAAYAHYPQNIVAFVTNQAIVKLSKFGWEKNVYAQVHDSVLMTVPKERVDTMARILKQAMSYELEIKGKKFIIPVELKTGKRWGEMEDLHV